MAPDIVQEASQLVVGQEGGRAAAEMQLRDGCLAPEQGRLHGHLARQGGEIARGTLVMPGHDLVAGAVVAHRIAERDMHIQR